MECPRAVNSVGKHISPWSLQTLCEVPLSAKLQQLTKHPFEKCIYYLEKFCCVLEQEHDAMFYSCVLVTDN